VRCPALVQIAEHDAVTPRHVAQKAAGRMTDATVHVYDCGHFDPYVEPYFDTTITDQLDFLTTHPPVNPSTPASGTTDVQASA
jgi:pimeloyl-ACP methyl ester carboxylesterase